MDKLFYKDILKDIVELEQLAKEEANKA